MIFGIDLKDHAILVRLSVDSRDLPLAEGVVERVVHRLHGYAEPPRNHAVGRDHDRVSILLDVGGHMAEAVVVLQLPSSFLAQSEKPDETNPTSTY